MPTFWAHKGGNPNPKTPGSSVPTALVRVMWLVETEMTASFWNWGDSPDDFWIVIRVLLPLFEEQYMFIAEELYGLPQCNIRSLMALLDFVSFSFVF